LSPTRKKRRIDTAGITDARKQSSSKNQYTPQWQHWILGALGSPTLAVRQMATQILISSSKEDDWLRNALVDYLQCQVPGPPDVQCMGLLVELSSSIPHLQGWNWASRALLSLATSCSTGSNIHNKAIRTRLWLFIHYAHVQSEGPCGDLYRRYLWKTSSSGNQTQLTPLASLIGAQVVLASDLPEVARTRLAELVNPRPHVATKAAPAPADGADSPTTVLEEEDEVIEEVDMDTVEEGDDDDDDDDDEHDDDDDDDGQETDLNDDEEEEVIVEEVEEHDDAESHDDDDDEGVEVEVEEEHHDDDHDEDEEGQDQEMVRSSFDTH
jgi:hypothetical protein